jgi:hypothetical protein
MNNTACSTLDPLTRALLPIAADAETVGRLDLLLGEFCHVLRDQLNCVKLGLYLARRSEAGPQALDELARYYREIEQLVECLQAVCRPLRLTRVLVPLGAVLAERRASWAQALAARGRPLHWSPPRDEAAAALDPAFLGDALDGLVSWRAETGPGDSPVQVSWEAVGDEVRMSWAEPEADHPQRAPEGPPSLALPRLARVAAAHGGRVELSDGDAFRVDLFLPACTEPPSRQHDPNGAARPAPATRRRSRPARREPNPSGRP